MKVATSFTKIVYLVLCLAIVSVSWAQPSPEPILGDYNAEPRVGAHVDADRLVRRLQDLGANTYMWPIRGGRNDWKDLEVFLPKANQAGIAVWVFLFPPSMTPAYDQRRRRYPEPYRIDYIRWAEEIAKLSLQHPNLKGYVMDDFWRDVRPDRFTPDYIRRVVATGKAVNPKIKFYALMYYPEIGERFVDLMAPWIDGVVGAYPRNSTAVENALAFLEDQVRLPSMVTIKVPPGKSSEARDEGVVVQEALVLEEEAARLSFRYHDDYEGSLTGHRQLQVRVDDQLVWETDAAGHDERPATIDIQKAVQGKQKVRLSFGVRDKKGVDDMGVEASFMDLKVRGLQLKSTDLGDPAAWEESVAGPFSIHFVPARGGAGQFRLPLIVMPAGDAAQYKKRHQQEGTPENIARHVKMATDLAQQGRIEGVVTFALDKQEGSASFETVREVFAEARNKKP